MPYLANNTTRSRRFRVCDPEKGFHCSSSANVPQTRLSVVFPYSESTTLCMMTSSPTLRRITSSELGGRVGVSVTPSPSSLLPGMASLLACGGVKVLVPVIVTPRVRHCVLGHKRLGMFNLEGPHQCPANALTK